MALEAVKVWEYALPNVAEGKDGGFTSTTTVVQLTTTFETSALIDEPLAALALHNCPGGALVTLMAQFAPCGSRVGKTKEEAACAITRL